jgi:GMP reductase
MKVEDGLKLDFSDVLIKPRRTLAYSRNSVNLNRDFSFMYSPKKWEGIPIFAANMDTTGTFAMAKALQQYKLVTCLHKQYSYELVCEFFLNNQLDYDYTWVSTGITDKDLERLKKILQHCPNVNICVDVANGYNQDFVEKIAYIRSLSPESIIMAGNVCTAEMAQELVIGGKADIVKVGIGPGSVCTTRLVSGIGYPQLSAIMNCANTVHGLNSGPKRMALICADGGCVYSGDIAKAFGGDADFCMLGGMFSGCEENEGEWEYHIDREDKYERYNLYEHSDNFITALVKSGGIVKFPNKQHMDSPHVLVPKYSKQKKSLKFHGMSSSKAQGANLAKHRSSEGKEVHIPYKGMVSEVLDGDNGILGGLRSACSYVGVKELKNFADAVTFIRVNNQHNTVYGTGLEK